VRTIIRWRFVAASAILAMAVSLLIGGLRGIRLGTLVIRASIGSVVFTVLAIGINLLVVKLFPEFFDSMDSKGTEYNGDGRSQGSLVDITLPTEESESSEEVGGSANGVAKQGSDGIAPVNESDRFPDSFSEVDGNFYGSKKDESSALGSERDPEELAQAIHTVITRDERG